MTITAAEGDAIFTAMIERLAIGEAAMHWVGTPFHHAARLQGVGVDCCQLLLAVYCDDTGVCGQAPALAFYPPDWFLHTDDERILPIVEQYAERLPDGVAARVGDIALFHFGRAQAAHAGIVVAPAASADEGPMIVHAFRGIGTLLEHIGNTHALGARLTGFWRLRQWGQA